MADLIELALRHVQKNGVTPEDAIKILDSFARGPGRDIPWENITPFLPSPLAERIDRAAVNWMMAHRATDNPEDL